MTTSLNGIHYFRTDYGLISCNMHSYLFLLRDCHRPPVLCLSPSPAFSLTSASRLTTQKHLWGQKQRCCQFRVETCTPAGPNATGCGAGQLLMCEWGREDTCVCAGRGRIKLFAGLPQNRNDLNTKCIKHKLLFICCTNAKRTTNINIKIINMAS